MKITVPMEHMDGKMEFFEVDASCPFEMFGYTFAAHRGLNADGSASTVWRVSEVSCGASVLRAETRAEAVRRAKIALADVGEKRLRQEVSKTLKRQKKAGRKGKS
jgi:hypothetical protein